MARAAVAATSPCWLGFRAARDNRRRPTGRISRVERHVMHQLDFVRALPTQRRVDATR